MRRRSKSSSGIKETATLWAVPAFLGAAVVLGGASRAEPLFALAVQALSALVLAVTIALARPKTFAQSRITAALLGLCLVFVAVTALGLVPLPSAFLSALPGRAEIFDTYRAVGMAVPAFAPLSLAPSETMSTLGGFIPPLAMLVLALSLPWRTVTGRLRMTILVVALCSGLFGLLQAFLGGNSGLYLYELTNPGSPVGFFANVNHQVTLLLMALPFAGAALSQLRFSWATGDRDLGAITLLVTGAGLICIVVLVSGSHAGYGLLGPVLALSLLVYRGRAITWRFVALGAVLAAVVTALAFAVLNSPVLDMLGLQRPDTLWAQDGRSTIFANTAQAIGAYWPAGTGLGSFEQVYPRFEDPTLATPTFVNMAHNDYLQIVLELGLVGVVLIVAGLGWLIWATVRVWADADLEDVRLRRAASVALLIVVTHSLVDYPARTAGIACFAALCAALLVKRDGGGGDAGGRRERATPTLEI